MTFFSLNSFVVIKIWDALTDSAGDYFVLSMCM